MDDVNQNAKYGYVYLTKNVVNGKMYIGQHAAPLFESTYIGSGVNLRKAIKKHGFDSFQVEVLAWANTSEELDDLELKYIREADAARSESYYNMIDTRIPKGNSGNKDFRHTDESRRKSGDGAKRRHEETKATGRSYFTPEGMKSMLDKIQERWTKELRAIQSEKSRNRPRPESDERWKDLSTMLLTMTQSEIAAKLGVNQSAVAHRIREHEVSVARDQSYHDKVQQKREDAAALAHQARRRQGDAVWAGHDLAGMYKTMTQAQIAKIVGVSQVRVGQRLRQFGITKG